ncbi:MAG TPA: sugar ABC transporter permease [Bacillus sp. (in: firmicutes)]|nr:sugar ABC transporter permease [Bacillus sp. (in: firmicutes)]
MSRLESAVNSKISVQEAPRLTKSLRKWTSYLFVIPSLVFIGLFMIFPIAYNLIISFQNVTIMNLAGEREFVGWLNYITIFKDAAFSVSLKNSVLFTSFCIIFQFVIGFAFALFFNQKFPGRNLVRSLLLLAWMFPIVITATLFKWMLSNDYGIVNYVLLTLGVIDQPIHWLTESSTSLLGTIIGNVWVGIPFNMIILLSALQSLPEDLYEAARIDGASRFQQFYHITIPLLKPTILILLMLGIVYTFKVFDLIFIMTAGGPVNSSTVLPLYAYQLAFEQFEFSKGAAVASIMFVIMSVFALVYLWMIRKEEQ